MLPIRSLVAFSLVLTTFGKLLLCFTSTVYFVTGHTDFTVFYRFIVHFIFYFIIFFNLVVRSLLLPVGRPMHGKVHFFDVRVFSFRFYLSDLFWIVWISHSMKSIMLWLWDNRTQTAIFGSALRYPNERKKRGKPPYISCPKWLYKPR